MIKVQDVIATNYRVPDLDKMEKFLVDFGMVRARRDANKLYMRGAGPLPYITSGGGRAMRPSSPAASRWRRWPSSRRPRNSLAPRPSRTSTRPAARKRVRVKGPDGHRIDLVQGQTPAEPMSDVRGR